MSNQVGLCVVVIQKLLSQNQLLNEEIVHYPVSIHQREAKRKGERGAMRKRDRGEGGAYREGREGRGGTDKER